MSKLKMQKLRVIALAEDRKALLERLQRIGTLQPEYIPEEERGELEIPDTSAQQAQFEDAVRRINSALEIMERYSPKKSSLLSSYKPRDEISVERYNSIVSSRDETLDICNRLIEKKRNIEELTAENIRLQSRIDALVPWLPLDVPMRFTGTRSTAAIVGCLPGQMTGEDILGDIAYRYPHVEALYIEIVSQGSEATCVFIECLREQLGDVEAGLRNLGFSRPVEMSKKPPAECSEELRGRIETRRKKIARLEEEIRELAERRGDVEYLLDYYTMRLQKYQAIGRLASSGHTFVLEGWVPERDYGSIERACEEQGAFCERIETLPDDDPPVVLKNGGFTEAGEPVVEMYSLPSKRDIDPTPVMAIFYYILFGIMLGDAAYGVIMMIATLFVLLKFKPEAPQRKNMKLFFFSGLSSTIWGIVFGSYFGNLPDVIAHTFFGVDESVSVVRPLWFDPISDPMRMMYFAVALGVVHVLTGLVMGIVTSAKNRDPGAAVFDYLSWLMLLLCGIAYGLTSVLGIVLPQYIAYALLGGIALGILMILFMSGRSSSSFGKRIAKGAYALYGVTSYLSDFMSYSRLLALGLATGVISQVFNMMASMMAKKLISMGSAGTAAGAVVMLIICLGGHLFNLGISLIGCYVHTNRLQYIEFFGKFYEGGGREYEPLSANTKYFKFKEEKAR